MSTGQPPDLAAENAELRSRLAEAEDTLEAIRSGAVDAICTRGPAGEQVFTLQGAETPYRLLMESMNEGAATLGLDGTVLYCNGCFAKMVGLPPEQVVGSDIGRFVPPAQQAAVRELVARASATGSKHEAAFLSTDGETLSVLLSLHRIKLDSETIGVVATDLTESKKAEAELLKHREHLQELVDARTAELQSTNAELARFNQAMVGRELRMVELKKEINALCARVGELPRYPSGT
jgi:PAS domain S-box-containing protein